MQSTEAINRLLENELSATATYQLVLDTFRDAGCLSELALLMPIYQGHKDAASSLQTQIRELGGTPVEHAGHWGVWPRILLGGVNRLGMQTALKILHEAEKINAEDYEKALWNNQLPLSIRCLIEWKLLLMQKSQVRNLGLFLAKGISVIESIETLRSGRNIYQFIVNPPIDMQLNYDPNQSIKAQV